MATLWPHQTTILRAIPEGNHDLHLALSADRPIDIDRTDLGDERLADMHFAVADAFKRARRRPQD
ncbi:hypothetical protein ABGN05_09045 [Aquibium sp. LZ166]|uniref:Uncharacterized protein n=1 Tax=Aquibium pacificus TaxID=3153579 RepID=A0ABV3SHJ8_9HYPH